MGMWTNDVVYGGEQLEPNVTLDMPYVLWQAEIVAENVVTSLGNDGVKAEVIVSQLDGMTPSEPRKFGTFASTLIEKIQQKSDGDLPAVVTFGKVESKQFDTDAFVMTFVEPYTGDVPELPAITVIGDASNLYERAEDKAKRERQRKAAKSDDVPL